MKKFAFKSIRSKFTVWFVILGLAPLLIGILITYHQQVRSIKEETFDKLITIRDLKVQALEYWIDEKESWMKSISEDKELRELEQFFQKKVFDKPDYRVIENMRRTLKRHLTNFDDFFELLIINVYSGKVIASTNSNNEGMDESQDPSLTEFLAIEDCYIKDIHLSRFYHVPAMAFAIPIRCIQHNGKRIIGILVARVNLGESLFAFLLNRTGLGKTGETLIVNKDVVALNELRWHENAPLDLQIQAESAVNAARGKTGIIETADYRGENVLAAYTYIPQTGWGFVAKQDMVELYAPIKSMTVNFIILICGTILSVIIIAFLLARSAARPIVEMGATAEKIRKGNLSARNRIIGSDELAVLAETFNEMAESIESQVELREINDEVTQTIVDAKDLPAFRTNILKKFVGVTDSQMGAYFVLNRDTNIFEPFTAIGVTHGLLKPFDASALEGELGMVVETKKITYIKDIPKDSIFKFRTFTGTILPKEIISIPIIIDDIVSGVVSLASIKPYPRKVLDIMEQPWATGFGVALSNMWANAETVRLATELNEKNQELEAQTEELQVQSEELQQTAEELQEQNLELEIQRQQVEEANRLKGEFLSNMSHELRTPLNSVMALSRVLMRQAKEKLSEEEAGYLEIIERNGKNLLSLINDILDLSKIEAGRMDVSPKIFPISSTIETIMERLEPLAEDKGIKLDQEIPDDLPQIESDETRVHQILQNLIGNATKFTEQGSVTVSARSDAENIHIEVSDTGIGISKKDLPHIFEEFRQVDGTSARPYEGTGLGLTIAYRAARMLGGNIFVESTLGKGSTFTLILPIRWQGVIPVSEPVIFKPPPGIEPARKTVLVVDDEPDALTMISGYLSSEGYHIITAASGKEAVRLAQRHRPFAITLDIIMPETDGWEVLQELKDRPETANIPVIIVSVSDDRETGIALGAVGFITKPVNRDLLIAEINRIGGPSPYTIVVADDNEIELKEMARAIEQEGMKAIVAKDGNICMDMIKEFVPDVLVLDLIMPEMDGFEVLDRVRSDPKTRELPVIVVTAKDLTTEEKEKLSGNVLSVLAKSHTTSTALLEKIKKILADIEKCKKGSIDRGREAIDRILLVEDNEAAVIQIKTLLENAGYIVDVVRGGQEALDYMSRIIPCGIILDLMMPEVDGFQVLDKMRGTKATAKVPVLVLTAKDLSPQDLSKLSANNIQQLVQKGDIDQQGLLFKIRSMLGGEPRVGLETENLKLETPNPGAEQGETGQRKGGQACIRQRETGNEQTTRGTAGKRATILVVEDNPDNMTTIKAVLQHKYEILEAADGEKGLNMALTERPDLVLLDMSLPKMDGFTVVRKVKENRKADSIPVIGLTARAMKGDREKVIDAGCDDYIPKPIDPEKVLAKIEKWLLGSGD